MSYKYCFIKLTQDDSVFLERNTPAASLVIHVNKLKIYCTILHPIKIATSE